MLLASQETIRASGKSLTLLAYFLLGMGVLGAVAWPGSEPKKKEVADDVSHAPSATTPPQPEVQEADSNNQNGAIPAKTKGKARKQQDDSPPKAIPKPPPPPTVNNCPNGICISGGIASNPTVNNFGPPEPKVTWGQEQFPGGYNGIPTTLVKLSVDRSLEIAAFGAVCERVCKTISFRPILPAVINGNDMPLGSKTDANFTGYVLGWPRPLGAGIQIEWLIQAEDGKPCRVLRLGKIKPEDLPDNVKR